MSRAQLTSTVEQNTGGAVAPYVGAKNFAANGGMDVWQRGTSFANLGNYAYTADRWQGYIASTYTVSQQDVSSTLNNFKYALRAQRNSSSTATNYFNIEQGFETLNIIPLRGNVVTVSFWARCGANFSATSNQLGVSIFVGTGTERVRNVTAFTSETTPINTNATLTTTYQKFTFTSTAIPTTSTQMALTFSAYPTGTAGANDWYEITGVQLEVGSVATPFSRAGGTLQGELALCQRYYQRISSVNATTAYMHFGMGQAYSTSAAKVPIPLKVTMRTAPSISSTGSIGLLNSVNTAINNASLAVEAGPGNSPDVCSLVATGSSGLTAGNATTLIANANNTCYLEISAEL